MNKIHKLVAILLILMITLITFVVYSWATIAVNVGLEELSKRSNLIIIGRVINTESKEFSEGNPNNIYTFITIEVDDVIKGNFTSTVTIKQPGGIIGNRMRSFDGMPQFSKGESVLVFLHFVDDSSLRVYGMSQGKFSIIKDEESGKAILKRNLTGLTFLGEKPNEINTYLQDIVPYLKSIASE